MYYRMQRVSVQGMKAIVVAADYGSNTVLRRLQGRSFDAPSKHSVCVAPGVHVLDRFGMYLNHSCAPSARVESGYLITSRELYPGTEVTIDYRKSEKVLAYPFTCLSCGGQVTGEESICLRETSYGMGWNPPI
jgi:hypothetical protein